MANWSPSPSDMVLWLDASDASTITKDGSGNVSQWDDKSTNGYTYTASGTNRPTEDTSTFAKNALSFNGTSHYMSGASGPATDATQIGTFVAVLRRPSTGIHTIPLASSASSNGFPYYWFNDNFEYSEFGGDNVGNDARQFPQNTSTGNFIKVVTVNGPGATQQLITNGGTPVTTGPLAFNGQGATLNQIGLRTAAAGEYTTGVIGEMLLYDSVLSVADRQRVEGYLAHKWGLTSGLPGGHPYKSTAPQEPVLTSPSGSATGQATLSASVTTDVGTGTLHWVVTTSDTAPSVAQVQAGQDHTGAAAADSGSQAVSATGAQTISATGLTASTTYYVHFQQQEALGLDSAVSSTAVVMSLWQPDSSAKLKLWLDASDVSTITKAGGGHVSQWDDKSANGYAFTATGSQRPNHNAATLDSKPVLQFDGSERLESTAAASTWAFLHDGSEYSIFAVWKHGTVAEPDDIGPLLATSAASSAQTGAAVFADDRSAFSIDNRLRAFVGRGVAGAVYDDSSADNYFPGNQFQLTSFDTDLDNGTGASRGTLRADADPDGIASNGLTNPPTASAPTHTLRIGEANGTFLTGEIAEILIFEGRVSDGERRTVEGYLAHKWGLEGALFSTHQYKKYAPDAWEPTTIRGLEAWYDADDSSTLTTTGSLVDQWDDKSGQGHNATQTGTNRPSTTTWQGRTALNFVGSPRKFMTAAAPSVTDEVGVWVVATRGAAANSRVVDTRGNGALGTIKGWQLKSYQVAVSDIFAVDDGAGNSRTLNNLGLPSGGGILGGQAGPSVGAEVWVNGTVQGGLSSVGSRPLDIQTAGSLYIGGNAVSPTIQDFTGIIGELVIANERLYQIDRHRLEGYFAHKWGFVDDLPATHPFKILPPAQHYDEHYASVSYLLSGEGPNGGTGSAVRDRSSNNFATTLIGTAQISTARARVNTGSLNFPSGAAAVSPNDAAFTFGTGDFTIEGWWYPIGTNPGFVDDRQTSSGGTDLVIYDYVGTSTVAVAFYASGANRINGPSLTKNAWNHIAVSRVSGVTRLFVNGVQHGGDYSDANNYNATNLVVGSNFLYSNASQSYIDEFRVTKGVGRYTSNFVPPEHAFADAAPTDSTAPVLSAPTGSATGTTTLDASVTTDESNGTLYWVVTTSATQPSIAQIQAGNDHTGSAAADSGNQAVSVLGVQNINATGLSDSTTYYVHFQHQDAAGNDSNRVVTAGITTDPATTVTITSQPSDTTVDENTVATFTVAATGVGAVTYQWQEDSGAGFGNMAGETSATLDFTAVLADDANQYRCVVTDDNGSLNSNTVTLTVNDLNPTIDTQPVNETIDEYTNTGFSVAATSSGGTLTYQWQEDAGSGFVDMSGQTSPSLVFTATLGVNGNDYRCVVTDDNGSVNSNAASLTVNDISPTIDTQPVDATVIEGDTATFTVAASGPAAAGPLAYQWYDASGPTLLTGETSDTLSIDTVLADSGNQYYCVVTDFTGTTQTNTVTLTVTEVVVNFTLDLPATRDVMPYANVRFDVMADDAVYYEWYVDGELRQTSTRSWFRVSVGGPGSTQEVHARAFLEGGQEGNSTICSVLVLDSTLVDNSTPRTPSTPDAAKGQRHTTVDWASQAAALEGEVVEVEDYIFSNRIFTRRDKLRNPKDN